MVPMSMLAEVMAESVISVVGGLVSVSMSMSMLAEVMAESVIEQE